MDSLSIKQVLPRNTATQTLLAGLMLGIAGDVLFWESAIGGFGLSIWIALMGGAALALHVNASVAWRRQLVLWSSVALAASLLIVLRASVQLIPLLLLVIAMCAIIVLMQASSSSLGDARLRDYLRSACQFPLRVLPGFYPILARLHWQGMSKNTRVLGLVKGAFLAVPLLLVFAQLFSSADANYDRYVSQFVDTIGRAAPQHLLFVLLVGWPATGLLTCTQYQRVPTEPRRPRLGLGGEETLMIMGSLVILFVSFVVLQASYLFGGQTVIGGNTGLTVADYARRGFFELLTVAALTLAVLLGFSSIECSQRILRPLATMLIACVLVILASAWQRLSLYIDSFGLSLSRVFAAAFMVWLAGNLLSFAFTCLRGRERGFASGLVITGIVAIFLVALANPAAVVARVNLDRSFQENTETDWNYLLNLGPDAVPTLLAYLPQLPRQVQCQVANELLFRYDAYEQSNVRDWRTWNYGRESAHNGVMNTYTELFELSGREQARAHFTPRWPQQFALIPLCEPATDF